jgi:cyclopropane fatty-acyl-phospholipid synthase-like methyltransferase
MITETGYWTSDDTQAIHVHDQGLANWILNYLQNDKDKQLIDFGCGMGDYLKKLHDNGFSNLHGFEGEVRKGSPKFIKNWDLSNPIKNYEGYNSLKKSAYNTICLEVGEHIPKQYESIFLDNITSLTTNKIILSWAIIGQLGDGHVNCMNNDEVILKMDELGFKYLEDDSISARNSVSPAIASWFLKTIMIFQKKQL